MSEGSMKPVDEKGNKMVSCLVCLNKGVTAYFHQLATHLKTSHGMSVAFYQEKHNAAPIISEFTKANLAAARAKSPLMAASNAAAAALTTAATTAKKPPETLHFGVASLTVKEDLTEDEQALVPLHDDDYELDESKLEILALGVQQNDNVLMVGPTGCGKTSLAYELAALVNHPTLRINMNGDFRAADFVGEKVVEVVHERVLQDGVEVNGPGHAVVVWRDGILPTAMRSGFWLLIDELDACPAAIAFVLQAVLEGKPLVLSSNNGEIVKPHPDFRIIATANTIGKGDDTGMYTGTNVMNEAFLDRFGTVMQFQYAGKDVESQIMVAKTKIDKATADKMVECATLVRKGAGAEECYCSFSTRRLIRWASKTVALRGGSATGKHKQAAEITILNKLSKDDRVYVEAILQRVMGS